MPMMAILAGFPFTISNHCLWLGAHPDDLGDGGGPHGNFTQESLGSLNGGNQAHSSLCVFLFERWRNHSRSSPGSPVDGHHPTFQSAIELVGDLVQNPIGCSVIRLALVSKGTGNTREECYKDVSFLNLLASTRAGITLVSKTRWKEAMSFLRSPLSSMTPAP